MGKKQGDEQAFIDRVLEETKTQDKKLYLGTLESPFKIFNGDLLDYSSFKAKNEQYHSRLNSENDNFNKAVDKCKQNKKLNDALKEKRRNRNKTIRACIGAFIFILFALMSLLLVVVLQFNIVNDSNDLFYSVFNENVVAWFASVYEQIGLTELLGEELIYDNVIAMTIVALYALLFILNFINMIICSVMQKRKKRGILTFAKILIILALIVSVGWLVYRFIVIL